MRDPQAFSALRSPNYRLFIIGQVISLVGQWIKRVGMSWIVYKLTSSGFLLGVSEVLSLAPILLIGIAAGAWLDRTDLRRTFIITQALCVLQSLMLAALWSTGRAQFWEVAILAFMLGLIASVDTTCRQSAVSFLVDSPDQIKSAIALNSIVFNVSRFAGPAVGGLIIHWVGETACFLTAAAAQLPIILLLLFAIRMRTPKRRPTKNFRQGISDGLAYVRDVYMLRKTILLLFCFATFSTCILVMFPLIATQILDGGPRLLGMLITSQGIGSLLTGLVMAMFISLRSIPRWFIVTIACSMIGHGLYSFCHSIPLAFLLSALIGFGQTGTFIAGNTLLQSVAEEDKRSRVLSLYVLTHQGIGPIGALMLGGLADWIGVSMTMGLIGIALFGVLLVHLTSEKRMSDEMNQFLDTANEEKAD